MSSDPHRVGSPPVPFAHPRKREVTCARSTNFEIQGTQLKWAQRTPLKPSPSVFHTLSDTPHFPRLVRTLSAPAPGSDPRAVSELDSIFELKSFVSCCMSEPRHTHSLTKSGNAPPLLGEYQPPPRRKSDMSQPQAGLSRRPKSDSDEVRDILDEEPEMIPVGAGEVTPAKPPSPFPRRRELTPPRCRTRKM